jgi:hypothetical protein
MNVQCSRALLKATVSFQLHSFHNQMCPFEAIIPFLSSQHSLRVYHQPNIFLTNMTVCSIPTPFLPLLTDVNLPQRLMSSLSSRSLTKIDLTVTSAEEADGERDMLMSLASNAPQLVSFSVDRMTPVHFSISLSEYVKLLAENAPFWSEYGFDTGIIPWYVYIILYTSRSSWLSADFDNQ